MVQKTYATNYHYFWKNVWYKKTILQSLFSRWFNRRKPVTTPLCMTKAPIIETDFWAPDLQQEIINQKKNCQGVVPMLCPEKITKTIMDTDLWAPDLQTEMANQKLLHGISQRNHGRGAPHHQVLSLMAKTMFALKSAKPKLTKSKPNSTKVMEGGPPTIK